MILNWFFLGPRQALASSVSQAESEANVTKTGWAVPSAIPQFHTPGLVQKETGSSRATQKEQKGSLEAKRDYWLGSINSNGL